MAWAYILRNTPMMSNPFEYREALWNMLYLGEPPKPKVETPPPSPRGRRGRGTTPPPKPGPPRAMTSFEKRRLDAFNAEILALQAKRKAEADKN